MLIDHHCHLDFPAFAGDLEEVLARARGAGVSGFVTISTRIEAFDQVAAIATSHADVFCSVGTHPHHAAAEPSIPVADIVALARHPKVVAIGEAGLDYFYDRSPRDVQARVFRTHIAAAQETGLPLVVHTREADADTAAILEAEAANARLGGVLHCLTGGPELAARGLELGFYISFSGILTFPKAQALRRLAASIPLDRLLVETDAPYLAPGKHRGKRNEPAFVVATLAELAKLKGVSVEELARITSENFFRLYSKAPRAGIAP